MPLSGLGLRPECSLVVVPRPRPAARTVASRVGVMAGDTRMPIAGVVENMSGLICAKCGNTTPLFGCGGGQQLGDELGVPLLGQAPLDAALLQAGHEGLRVVVRSPRASTACGPRAAPAPPR
mgnify:CR=1 FL=1